MICLAIGLGVLGFAAMRRARRCRGGWHHRGWHGRWHGHGAYGHHGSPGARRWMLHAALARLDASPAQERAIIAELEKLEERVHTARRGLKDARGDLGAAVRSSVLDDAALGAVMGRVDATTGEIRAAAVEALRNVHALLDDGQRAQLADLLDRGGTGGAGFWRGGPYR